MQKKGDKFSFCHPLFFIQPLAFIAFKRLLFFYLNGGYIVNHLPFTVFNV